MRKRKISGKNIKISTISSTWPERDRESTAIPGKRPVDHTDHDWRDHERDEARDHLRELRALVEWANRECEKRDSRYRFRLRSTGDNVYIDIVVADRDGKISAILASEITHDDLLETVKHIQEGEGLLFEAQG